LSTLTQQQKVLENAYIAFPTLWRSLSSHLKIRAPTTQEEPGHYQPCRDFARAVRPLQSHVFWLPTRKTFPSGFPNHFGNDKSAGRWKSISQQIGWDTSRWLFVEKLITEMSTTHLQLPAQVELKNTKRFVQRFQGG
jgi:hypothetical protein